MSFSSDDDNINRKKQDLLLAASDFVSYDKKLIMTESASRYRDVNKAKLIERLNKILNPPVQMNSKFDLPDGYKKRQEIRQASIDHFQNKYSNIMKPADQSETE